MRARSTCAGCSCVRARVRCCCRVGESAAEDVQFTDVTAGARHRLHAAELRDVEQVPDRDDGRRRGAARLRQRRPARHLLHERREARRPDAGRHAARQVRPEVLEPAVSPDSRTARSPTSPRRRGSPACRRTPTAWASRSATTTTTASPISTSPTTAATRCIATTATARSRDVTARAGVAAGGWSASAGFFDYDNDGKLDLFVTRYVEWTFQTNRYCGEKKPGYRAYCHPDNFEAVTNVLYRNNGDGTFTDVSAKSGIASRQRQGAGRRVRRLRQRRLHRRLRRQRLGAVVPVPQQRQRHVHRGRACSPASASTRTARPSPAWASTSPTTTTTAGPISSSPTCRTSATGCSATTATAASAT